MPQPQGPPKALGGSDERKENGMIHDHFLVICVVRCCTSSLALLSLASVLFAGFAERKVPLARWGRRYHDITLKGAWKLNTTSIFNLFFWLGSRGIYSKPEFGVNSLHQIRFTFQANLCCFPFLTDCICGTNEPKI